MGAPQIIKTETGEELIVLTRRDYDALLAQSGDEAAEDRMTSLLIDESEAAIARGDDVALPLETWRMLESGANPFRVVREYRNVPLPDLAEKTEISIDELGEIEAGHKLPAPQRLKAIARALGVPVSVLVDP